MKPSKLRLLLFAIVVAGGAAGTVSLFGSRLPHSDAYRVEVTLPDRLSKEAERGKDLFAANCASCHGDHAGGSDRGPPLVHSVYEPNHHADISFVLAAQNGVRSHHWLFGNMPPQPGVTKSELLSIVRYVRELQLANGIGATRRGDG